MKKVCNHCGKEFDSKSKAKFCSTECKLRFNNLKQFPDGSDYAEF